MRWRLLLGGLIVSVFEAGIGAVLIRYAIRAGTRQRIPTGCVHDERQVHRRLAESLPRLGARSPG